jgi:hypothetical protein
MVKRGEVQMSYDRTQITKMEMELLGKARFEVQQHAEMAKLMELESPFDEDKEIKSQFLLQQISQKDQPCYYQTALET